MYWTTADARLKDLHRRMIRELADVLEERLELDRRIRKQVEELARRVGGSLRDDLGVN